MKHRPVLAAAVVALAVTVAGCSSSPATPSASGPSSTAAPSARAGVVFNDADVTFLNDMYPHHAQALDMATMVPSRSTNQAVVDLATKIKGEQQPEMDTMTSLLASFGKPTPSTDASMGGMGGTGTPGMSGMMSADDMTNLATLTGATFDSRWLTMMIAHHTGAVEMSTVELANGSNADAKTLATTIIAAQQAEITTMNGLLAAA